MTNRKGQGKSWLLSSAGRRGSLLKLLRENSITGKWGEVVATDFSDLSAAGHLADHFVQVPAVSDSQFVDRTMEIALAHDVGIIVPTIDPEIGVFADSRAQFEDAGIQVWVSSSSVAQLGWDKWALYLWLRQCGLPTIETFQISDVHPKLLAGPVVAKPRSGSGGKGVVTAPSVDQLDISKLDERYIIQRRAPGVEVTVDVAVGRSGRVLGVVPRRRIEVRGGEVSKGVTVDYPAVISVVREVVSSLQGAYGVLNVQVFYDPKTLEVNVIEINPRFGGGYPLTHLSGANFIEALISDGKGENVPELSWSPGTLLLRYDAEVIVDDFDFRRLDV